VLALALAYLATFGSEICIVGLLPRYFVDRFALGPVHAGMLASIFGLANAYARPAGGWLADRFGRRRVLVGLLAGGGAAYAALASAPTLSAVTLAVVVASTLVQAGCGAVFAIVPLVRPTSTGEVAGVVGAAGNVGGLLFPMAFGYGLAWTGSWGPGFAAVASACGVAALVAARARLPLHEEHAAPVAPVAPSPSRVSMIVTIATPRTSP
jgi:nitrate/nitrite transporter NarK